MSGDISSVCVNNYFNEKRAKTAWSKIFDQHIEAHGLPEVYTQYLSKMTKAAEFYAKAYSGERWQIVRARISEAEAAQLITQDGEKIETTCARISKFMGFPVRPRECSVSEFYQYVAIMDQG